MDPAGLIDTALDRSIVLGYGTVGLAVRRRLPRWPADPPSMDGRVVLVTGAAGGIGLATAQGLARLGAQVHLLARSEERAQEAVGAVRAAVPGADVVPAVCDVSSLGSVRAFAVRFAAEQPRLDVLIHNAGVMPREREESADGVELTFATHVLGPFVLNEELAGLLRASAPARVIYVSSGGMYSEQLHTEDVQLRQSPYRPKQAYAWTKRAQVVMAEQWGEHLHGSSVVVHAMHPGWADTEGVRRWMPIFRALVRPIIRTAAQGADTVVWLAGAAEPLRSTGMFWHDRRRRPTHYAIGAGDDAPAERARLWDACVTLAGGDGQA